MCMYVCIYIERENHLESELDETSAQRKSPQYTIQSSLSPVSPWIFRFCVDNPWRVFPHFFEPVGLVEMVVSWEVGEKSPTGMFPGISKWDMLTGDTLW